MRTIWKYELGFDTNLVLPRGAVFLHFGYQGEPGTARACAWFEVDSNQFADDIMHLRVVVTGAEVPTGYEFLGTAQDGPYVGHLYRESIIQRVTPELSPLAASAI